MTSREGSEQLPTDAAWWHERIRPARRFVTSASAPPRTERRLSGAPNEVLRRATETACRRRNRRDLDVRCLAINDYRSAARRRIARRSSSLSVPTADERPGSDESAVPGRSVRGLGPGQSTQKRRSVRRRGGEDDVLRWPYVRPEQHIEGTPAARVAARYRAPDAPRRRLPGWPGPGSLSGLCAVMVGRHIERKRPMRRAAAAADEVPERRSQDIAR
jgi:hypothetical protein